MDFIAHTWWLWLLIAFPLLAFPPRDRKPHAARELVMAVSGILFMISVVLNFFPKV